MPSRSPSPRGARMRRGLAADEERWRAYFDTDELVFYCPECAEREFG
jgi:hypothetical protein